MDSYNKTN